MTIATSLSPPDFAIVMRGYDRAQVDDYVATVQRLLTEAQEQARKAADARTVRAAPDQDLGPDPTVRLAAEPTTQLRAVKETPQGVPDFSALGERIVSLLRLAEEDAAARRQRGEKEADELLGKARKEAEGLRAAAQGEVDEIRAARANAQREAKAALDAAREQAEDLLQRTRRHAEDQAEAIVTQAEIDAKRLLDEARATAKARMEEAERHRDEQEGLAQAAAERHRKVIADLSRLRSTLEVDLGGGGDQQPVQANSKEAPTA